MHGLNKNNSWLLKYVLLLDWKWEDSGSLILMELYCIGVPTELAPENQQARQTATHDLSKANIPIQG
jgi:hypothetical protein